MNVRQLPFNALHISLFQMVSWVPFSPASCSTRGKPFPYGAFRKGLPSDCWVGAVRSWWGGSFVAGTICHGKAGMVCRVTSGSKVEEHTEFWVLVAGDELTWSEPDSLVVLKTVKLPGNTSKDAVGLYNNMVGTVSEDGIVCVTQDNGTFQSDKTKENYKTLVFRCPSSLKSLCRKVIRKFGSMKRGSLIFPGKRIYEKKTEIERYLAFKVD